MFYANIMAFALVSIDLYVLHSRIKFYMYLFFFNSSSVQTLRGNKKEL